MTLRSELVKYFGHWTQFTHQWSTVQMMIQSLNFHQLIVMDQIQECKQTFNWQGMLLFIINRSEVTFDLKITSSQCNKIDDFREGMELSFRSMTQEGPGEWIPLMYFANRSNSMELLVELPPNSEQSIDMSSTRGRFILRGYNISYVIDDENSYNVSVCGENVVHHPLQFRWLHNSYQLIGIKDVIVIDNITVRVRNSTHEGQLLQDCFDDQEIE